MKKILLIFVGLMLTTATFAQKKEFTLSDAMLKARAFYPESILNFNWIPDTECYSYLNSNGQILLKGRAENKLVDTLLTVQDFNSRAGAELNSLFNVQWTTANIFRISARGKYYEYNLVTKEAKTLLALEENAENATQHPKTGNVAYTLENNLSIQTTAGETLVVTSNNDKNIVSGQAIARSEFGITNGIFWSPKGTHLAFYQKDESNVADYPLLDNTTTPGSLVNIKYPMAGLGSEVASVGIYNVSSKKSVYFKAQHGKENYLTNVSWTPDEKFVLVAEVNREQDHAWLEVFDAATGAYVRTLFEETSSTWVEPEHPAFFPLETSNNFVWVSEKDGFDNLYYYDFDGKLIKQLTANAFVVKDILDFKNDLIYYTTTGENPTETQVYSVSLKGKGGILTRANGTHSVDISSSGKNFHDHFSSHTVASNDWIIDGRGKIVTVIQESEDKLQRDYTVGTAEIKTIDGKDGSKLYTRLIKPSNFDPNKKYPVLVYVYGGPHAQMITNSWLDGASTWMYALAEQGYLIFTLDNRGSGNRGKAFESQIHRHLGDVEIEDQMTGVDYLKSLPYVDAERLAVHGWSFGGFMTTSLMLRQAGTFNVGVAGGPVTDWKYYEVMYGERYMDRPEENEKGYEQASLMTHASKLEGDLLLVHGSIDNVVVMQHSLSLIQKFVELGIQMDFFTYPMHEHNVYGADRLHLMEKVLKYITENNQ